MKLPNSYFRDRKNLEKLEDKYLAPYAVKSAQANATRIICEVEHPYRTAIQRDRDRIIHSRAFRRLKHKQQVFLISEGDHFRTRLTHTLEVSQLSRTIAKTLGLNEELVEAIALGHDLGHTPFGHSGEYFLNNILNGEDNLNSLLPGKNLGGFKHNYQSLRVVDKIEKRYEFDGLNLTAFVREGILKHTNLKRDYYYYPDFNYSGIHFEYDSATTLEGQVVAICDEIAQRTHDLEDGIRAGFVDIKQIKKLKISRIVEERFPTIKELKDLYIYRNRFINGLINVLVNDIIITTRNNLQTFIRIEKRQNNFEKELVTFSDELHPLQHELDSFIYENIIYTSENIEKRNKNIDMLKRLFSSYVENVHLLPQYILDRTKKNYSIHNHFDNRVNNSYFIRIVADHIAGMTDRFVGFELDRIKEKLDKNECNV